MIIYGCYSYCEIELDQRRVTKKYDDYGIALGLLENEVQWYKQFNKFRGFGRCVPKMLDYSESFLVLQYVGEPITKETAPKDLEKQLNKIAIFLKAHHCMHCDILPSNLLVLKKKVFIIDFGWSVRSGCDPYRVWANVDRNILDCVGWNYRASDWPNDANSLDLISRDYSSNQESLTKPDPQNVTELNS